jgi:hypothetical protein
MFAVIFDKAEIYKIKSIFQIQDMRFRNRLGRSRTCSKCYESARLFISWDTTIWGLYWLFKPGYRVAVAEVDKTTNASPGELNPYVNITGVDCQKR